MPDAKDNAKQSGDTHPPELEDRNTGGRGNAEGATGGRAEGAPDRDLEDEGRAGNGINQAGYLKDKDAPGAGGDPSS